MKKVYINIFFIALIAGSCRVDTTIVDNAPIITGWFPVLPHHGKTPLKTGWYRVVEHDKGVVRNLGTDSKYHLNPNPVVTANHFKTMTLESLPSDSTLWQVVVHLDDTGRDRFAKATGKNIGKDLAFVLNDSLWSEPVRIQAKIPNGVIVISKRQFSKKDAEELRGKIEAAKDESAR